MSISLTHEFLLADTEDERLEVNVAPDGRISLMWWEDMPMGSTGIKKQMRNLHLSRADFEQIAATVKMWDDAPIRKGLSNA